MTALREDPPAVFGDAVIAQIEDLLAASEGAPAGDVLRYRLVDGSRVIVRPSGTEPKLKVYIDARADSGEAARAAVAALDAAIRELLTRLS